MSSGTNVDDSFKKPDNSNKEGGWKPVIKPSSEQPTSKVTEGTVQVADAPPQASSASLFKKIKQSLIEKIEKRPEGVKNVDEESKRMDEETSLKLVFKSSDYKFTDPQDDEGENENDDNDDGNDDDGFNYDDDEASAESDRLDRHEETNTMAPSLNANTDASSEGASSITSSIQMPKRNNEKVDADADVDVDTTENEVQSSTKGEDASIDLDPMPDNDNDDVSMESSSVVANEESTEKNDTNGDINIKTADDKETDADMSLAEDDKSQSADGGDTYPLQEKESQFDEDEKDNSTAPATSTEANNNRPTRTRSSYDNKDLTNETVREKSNNDDSRGKDDASLDTNNGNNNNASSNNNKNSYSSTNLILGFREPSTTNTNMTSSFLDSLSEEQRRVRTRHLPNVSGFRRLHKSEIKRDIATIKKMLKAATSKSGGRNGSVDEGSNNETESMDVDNNNAQGSGDETPSDEDATATKSSSKGSLSNSKSQNEANADLYNIFSLPYIQSPYICTDVGIKSSTNQTSEGEPALFSSPQVVESITAFNPPRPPESVGPKKMHRLHRWERNPQDVEVDLSNYRKTVNRTRQELHKAEMEREQIEVVGAHLRTHFLTQLKCMRHEMKLLNQQYDATQIKCVKAAELLTSKTRSRGASRNSYVMKDVISVLKSRGEKLNLNAPEGVGSKSKPWCVPGVGGVSFDQSSTELGSGWLLPGDKVSSPCGNGIVEEVYRASTLDINDKEKAPSEDKPPQSQLPQDRDQNLNENITATMSARVRVKLPFGVAYFSPSDLSLLESSVSYSDQKLCSRWKAMMENAKLMATVTDSRSVDNHALMQRAMTKSKDEKTGDIDDDDLTESSMLPDTTNADMDIDDASAVPNLNAMVKNNKMVSFGSGILPLAKNISPDVDLAQVEKNVELLIKGSSGVVGVRNNPSVPSGYRKWESNREELRILEGEAHQLRNKVYRQKRIRFLNERSCNSNKDRSDRFELLLTEMNADLDSLKKRLNEELIELGIDQSKAEKLLAEYEKEVEEEGSNGAKRKLDEENTKSSRQKVEAC